jgi:hypothetical protein
MIKLLVNSPRGNQEIVRIENTGGYFDLSRVLWDERTDGELPGDITLGKMERDGALLKTLPDYLPSHAEWLVAQEVEIDKKTKRDALEIDTKNDNDLAQLRAMSGDEINSWFDANVTNLNQTIKLLKKVVKSKVKQGTL